MPVPEESPTLRLALRDLDATDARALLRTAVKELVARGVFSSETEDLPRLLRGPKRSVVLLEGPNEPPDIPVLIGIARLVAGAPSAVMAGRRVRPLDAVAAHVARSPGIRQGALAAALAQLEAAGLVRREERRRLGIRPRTVHVRTPAGEAADAEATFSRPVRVEDPAGSPRSWRYADFDSSWDDAFDSSFDSGFGGGDGGGEGGGGGDGGGGGGG